MVHKRETNAEGLEKNFATNTMGELFTFQSVSTTTATGLDLPLPSVLGVYILTDSLIPLLQKSRDPRVVGLHTHSWISIFVGSLASFLC